MKQEIKDNGGRRSGQDRRLFFYAAYLPERRSGKDRRSGEDRRLKYEVGRVNTSTPNRRHMDHEAEMTANL